METLIEILIRLIGNLIDSKMKTPSQPTRVPMRQSAPAPLPATRKPAPRKAVRRPAIQSVAIAQPIVTPALSPVATASTGTAHAIAAKSIAASAAPNPKASATAESLREWMTPTTLRQQFMLTEILQPPLALRQNH